MSRHTDKERAKWQAAEYEKWKLAQARKSADVKPDIRNLIPEQEDDENDPLAQARRRNREKYPEIAAFVDEVRKHFPDAKVVSIRPLTPEEMEARRPVPASLGSDEPDEQDDQQ